MNHIKNVVRKYPQFKLIEIGFDNLTLVPFININHLLTNTNYQLQISNPEGSMIDVIVENWMLEKLNEIRDDKISKIITNNLR